MLHIACNYVVAVVVVVVVKTMSSLLLMLLLCSKRLSVHAGQGCSKCISGVFPAFLPDQIGSFPAESLTSFFPNFLSGLRAHYLNLL